LAENRREFAPDRRQGLLLFFGALLLNLAALGWLALQTMLQQERGFFILYLIASVLAFIPLPIILYRLFSLIRASYGIDRDGLYMQWGLRAEDIPMGEIEWVRRADDLPFPLVPPSFSLPGSVVGNRVHPDLGRVDFIASDAQSLLLVATPSQVFAISPRDTAGFLDTFQRSAELGSITPIAAKTARADFLLTALLRDRTARGFIIAGVALSAALLILVSFLIPTRQTVTLDFEPATQTMEATPSERLLLLPVLSLLMLTADIALGSYLYRKPDLRPAAYLTFASSLILPVSSLLLLVLLMLIP
jgi:hypothetical protein